MKLPLMNPLKSFTSEELYHWQTLTKRSERARSKIETAKSPLTVRVNTAIDTPTDVSKKSVRSDSELLNIPRAAWFGFRTSEVLNKIHRIFTNYYSLNRPHVGHIGHQKLFHNHTSSCRPANRLLLAVLTGNALLLLPPLKCNK